MTEIWKPIPGFEDFYEASDLGNIRSVPRTVKDKLDRTFFHKGRVLKQGQRGSYNQVYLSKDSKPKCLSVHVLVALTFLGPRPKGMVVCHWDDNGTNNNLSNLRYGTRRDNRMDYYRNSK